MLNWKLYTPLGIGRAAITLRVKLTLSFTPSPLKSWGTRVSYSTLKRSASPPSSQVSVNFSGVGPNPRSSSYSVFSRRLTRNKAVNGWGITSDIAPGSRWVCCSIVAFLTLIPISELYTLPVLFGTIASVELSGDRRDPSPQLAQRNRGRWASSRRRAHEESLLVATRLGRGTKGCLSGQPQLVMNAGYAVSVV